MSLFYLPTEPTSFFSPHHPRHHHHHQQLSQPSCPRFEAGFPPQQQFFNSFELDHLSQPSLFSPPHHPRHPHHHHQRPSSYQSPQSLAISPIEARKQRLLAEFAQSLDQLYPSTSPSSTLQVVAAPSYDRERIRYLEAQLKEEKIRKDLEAERIKLTKAKEVQKRREEEEERRAAALVEKQRQEQLHHAYLVRQHRLQQQQHHQQQQRLEGEEEQQRRRLLEYRQQQQPSGLGGLEQLFALLSGSEAPRREVEQASQPQQQQTISGHALGGIDQLLAFAQALENSPVPRAGDSGSEVEASESTKTPQQPSSRPTSRRKPLPPSPLAALRSLQTQLHSLLTSTVSTPTVLVHHLEKLLIDADGLQSDGDEALRRERRKFVQEVERALKSLEEKESVISSEQEELTAVLVPTLEESTASRSAVIVSSSSDSPASPTPLDASLPSSPAPLVDSDDDAASDTSSNVSESSERSSAVPSKSKGKGRAASVEDEEDEEEKYEFV